MSLASCQRRYSAGATNGSASATDAPWQVVLASDIKLEGATVLSTVSTGDLATEIALQYTVQYSTLYSK